MRASLDTNVLISFLLLSSPTSSTGVVLRASLNRLFTLLFTAGVADELDRKLTERSDLAARTPAAAAAPLLAILSDVAEHLPRLSEPLPEIGGDRKDDNLIAHAVAANADYLVGWDKDQRVLSR